MEKKDVIEFNGESCSWCENEEKCNYKRKAMEATREAIKGINDCTSAYCSIEVNCDYYDKDIDKYDKYNYGERQSQ